MKLKFFLTVIISICFISGFTQVAKQNVVIEKFTGIYCGACPSAVHNIHDLIENEDANVIVVSYHSASVYSDPIFENTDSDGRNQYYSSYITGYPTVIFDGIEFPIWNDDYQGYVNSFYNRNEELSPVSLSLSYDWNTGDSYTAHIVITKESDISSTDLRLQLSLTETNIDFAWQTEEKLYDVVRKMINDFNGSILDFSSSDEISLDFDFEIESDWNPDYLHLLAFVQDHDTREIFQGEKISIANTSESNDASPDMILELGDDYCGSHLAPVVRIRNSSGAILSDLDINYTINNGNIETFHWTGELTPFQQEIVYLPEIMFIPQINNNILTINTDNPNNANDEDDSNDEISHSFNGAPVIGTQPPIEFRTDEWPFLNSWELKDADGNIVVQSGNMSNYTVYTEEFDLEEGCYSFSMYDETGNGFVNWAGEDGYFIFYDHNGNEMVNIVDFDFELNILFEVSLSVDIRGIELSNDIEIYPNPSDNFLFIIGNENVDIIIFDILGNSVLKRQNINKEINIEDLSTGSYVIEIKTSDNHIIKKKFLKQ